MLHILTSAPLLDSFASELSGVAEITRLEPDGTFDAAPSTIFDGVFVGPEAFSFGRERHLQLNRSIAELILAKRVLWVHLCASGIDGAIFHAPMKAAHTAGAKLTHSPGVYATPIAHYCLAHMLSITRELREHAADQSAGVYNSRIQKDVRSMTVGIVEALAKRWRDSPKHAACERSGSAAPSPRPHRATSTRFWSDQMGSRLCSPPVTLSSSPSHSPLPHAV